MNLSWNLKDCTNESFLDLMAFKKLHFEVGPHEWLFQSTSLPFKPLITRENIFGGHLLGQAVYIASQTVPTNYICHSSSSNFLLPGIASLPLVYRIESLRDGKHYCVRSVKIFQFESKEEETFNFQREHLKFTATISFKIPQRDCLSYQADLEPELANKTDEELSILPAAPDVDNVTLLKLLAVSGIKDQWHPIECNKLDTSSFNSSKTVANKRIVHFFRSLFKLPQNPNLHVALLHYISDRNSLFTLLNLTAPYALVTQLASLSHSLVIHDLNAICDEKWLAMETWSDWAGDCRGLYNGRIFDSRKNIVASFIQDGVVVLAESQPKL